MACYITHHCRCNLYTVAHEWQVAACEWRGTSGLGFFEKYEERCTFSYTVRMKCGIFISVLGYFCQRQQFVKIPPSQEMKFEKTAHRAVSAEFKVSKSGLDL